MSDDERQASLFGDLGPAAPSARSRGGRARPADRSPDDDPLPDAARPLADRMRPRTLDEIVGQDHLLAPGRALRRTIESDRVPSMIFWGPPGTGKTTLAS